ncbi:serine hydrolase [Paenibacillus montaniterrae]|uniref:Serine hydrolase n=1 Tax=Paenibacillus montaniterrae TaxID=429341 RepID=A0A919YRA6_9BACL|nr:serine hydrolase domain-containing protein [Paenibacillus montaniterrae]GIP18643.1 serine hydrolase [Paenibacillus montaniterrae]
MKYFVKMSLLMIAALMFLYSFAPHLANAESSAAIGKIEEFVAQQQELSHIPGLAVVIVEKGETVYQKGFGYANPETKAPVTADTLFEIGSATKAFTGLAILQLEKEGLLKRSDDVRTYIPWLELTYNGQPQTITLSQLLHHTSGIPSNSITQIPESNAENALELTVKTLLGQQLNREPGSSFEYATINYDVLGLVIETVTKQPYDQYMKQHLLEPIGMENTFVGLHQVQSSEMAAGHKLGFRKAQPYTPPIYRGNIPAGYIVSNANDIAKWMNLQLGSDSSIAFDRELIQQSHAPDQSVDPFDKDTYYASGWGITEKNNKRYWFHAGENPTFTSYIMMQPDQQLGVAVLSNLNTTFTTAIAQGVLELWEGHDITRAHTDSYQQIDQIVSMLWIVVVSLGALFLLFSLLIIRKLVKKQRIRAKLNVKRSMLFIAHTLLVAAAITVTVMFPKIMLGGLPWAFIKVWAPTSITVFLYSVIAVSIIFYALGILHIFTKKTKTIN